MKIKIWLLLAGFTLICLAPRDVKAGACVTARVHDWRDCGCPTLYPGAGGPPMLKNCSKCGMPVWWVNEPYINLHISDTPLTYTTSSGQEMPFQFSYRQRAKMPEDDEISGYNHYLNGDLQYTRADEYSLANNGNGKTVTFNTAGGTNAVWLNNWNVSIQIWDPAWETNWFGNGTTEYPPSYGVYSQGFQALVYRGDGGMEYYNVHSNSYQTLNPQSLAILTNNGAGLAPTVETETGILTDMPQINNPPTIDTNGICWGDDGIGVRLLYPDGSQDVFSLSANIVDAAQQHDLGTFGFSTERLFLTQRIDPQGRVTKLGYQYFTNTVPYFYRLRYVVDPDNRTSTFTYSGGLQLTNICDPYGRQTTLTYDSSALLSSIIDAVGISNSFQYLPGPLITNWNYNPVTGQRYPTIVNGIPNGWLTQLTTPYGDTKFCYYQVTDSSVTDGFQKRAVYVTEPEGAQQLYYYIHSYTSLPASDTPPDVPGQVFDSGSIGTVEPALYLRNSFHWGRRQFPSLTSDVIGNLIVAMDDQVSNPNSSTLGFELALAQVTTNDFNKARMRHWLLDSADNISLTESISSERDPSPDSDGNIPGLRTWYSYPAVNTNEPDLSGSNPQIGCIAKSLPDGTSQYTIYHYYPNATSLFPPAGAGMVSNTVSSYTRPDDTTGQLSTQYQYGNGVDLLSVSNSAGQYINYGYNTRHQITSVTNALKQVTTLSWDEYFPHNLTGIQLPSGKNITVAYYPYADSPDNSSDLPEQLSITPEGRTFTYNSYSAGLPNSITDDLGVTLSNTWDGLNRLASTRFPDNTTISNVYYRLDVVAAKDRLTNWTYYVYDGLQHLTTVTNANNAVTSYSWCDCGSLKSIVDALNNPTTLDYDNQGNLTNIDFPDSSSLTYQYDLAGRMTNEFDGAGRWLSFRYNIQGQPTSVTSANGTVRQTAYDALKRPVYVTDASGVTVTNQYDAINELLSRTWPDNVSEGFGYSSNGLVAFTNRDQQATFYARDNAGRLLAVTNANHEVTQFGYNSLDEMTSLMNGLLHETVWKYNEYGWLTNKLDGLNRKVFNYAYNVDGWVTNRWMPEKGNTGYSYDGVGNLTNIAYPNQAISYVYDGLNRLTNMVDATGTNAFSYTQVGQLYTEDGPWANDTVTYGYVQGLRTALTISQPSGNWSQTYGYDDGWRMKDVISPAGTFNYGYNFQPASALVTSVSLPNGAQIANNFDTLGRLKETDLTNQWGHTLDGYTYILDALGLRTNMVRNLGLTSSTVSIGFDNIGQLTSWNATEADTTPRQNEQLGLAYDAADNLHTRVNGSLTQTFTTDAANQLNNVSRTGTLTLSGAVPAPATKVAVNGQDAQVYGDFTFARTGLTLADGPNVFTNVAYNAHGLWVSNTLAVNLPASVNLLYDNDGNLTNDGARGLAYNAENELTNITAAGNWKSDFVYDGLNRRRIERDFSWNAGTSSWVMTNEVHYVYDGYLLLQERDTNGNPLVTYTRGVDWSHTLHGAGGIGGLLARTDSQGSTFYHTDGSGNVTALMDGNENIVARYLYNPFGKLLGQWGTMANSNEMQFSSMPERHGLEFYPFRTYDPNLQRWPNQDPIQEEGGVNLYEFVGNDPINWGDPFGLLSPAPSSVSLARATAKGAEVAEADVEGDLSGGLAMGTAMTMGILGPGHDAESYPYGVNGPALRPFPDSGPQPLASAPPPRKPPCNTKTTSGFPGEENERHHRLPQQFKDWFSAPPRNLNIEDYTEDMQMQWHRGEDIGLHSQGYNDAWENFISANPEASAQETLQFMNNLETLIGFGVYPP